MKTETKHVRIFTLSLIIAGTVFLFFSSCSDNSKKEKQKVTAKDVEEELSEVKDTTAEYLEQKRANIMADYRSRIENTQQQIVDLRKEIETTNKKIENELKNRLDTLQKRQDELIEEFNKLEKSSVEAREEISKGLDKALDNLNKGIQNAKDEFNK